MFKCCNVFRDICTWYLEQIIFFDQNYLFFFCFVGHNLNLHFCFVYSTTHSYREVNLNHKALRLTKEDEIPVIRGKKLTHDHDKTLNLPPMTYGFFVVNTTLSICL